MLRLVPKETSINLRISWEFREELEALAAYHGLTMSSYAHSLLVKAVRNEKEILSNGYQQVPKWSPEVKPISEPRSNDRVEPVPDERVAYVRNLGELTDERKQKTIKKKAGRK
jgi:hypothetical protein